MSKMKTDEIIEAARFLVAYGDELDSEDGYDDAITTLLDKADDKVASLTYVVGVMSRTAGALLSRSAENAAAAERYSKRRGFLSAMAVTLAKEALALAHKEEDTDAVSRLEAWLAGDTVTQGYLLTMTSGAVQGTSDYEQRRWAEQVLTATIGDAKRASKITEAVKAHDEPLLAARLLIRTGGDRSDYLKELVKQLTAAANAEDDLVKKVKDLAETRLKKIDGGKYADTLGGWIRITSRNNAVAVHPEWDGKGKMKGPDVDKLPEHLVKETKEARKRELVTELKALAGIREERAKLAKELEEAEDDEKKAEIKVAIDGLAKAAPIPGAKLHFKPSSFIGTSK